MGSDKIISHFHDNKHVDENTKQTKEFKETEKIFGVREYVSILNKINKNDQLWKKIDSRANPKKILNIWFKYAAAILISFALGSTLIYFTGISKYDSQMASISSPRGQITSMTLFDGSTVWLNSESTIKYSKAFNKSKREVFIEGEAYFQVAKDKKKPFIVNLGNSQIKVHGTSFNVKAYPESNKIEAALEEGKIEFITENESIFLKPSEQVSLSKVNGTISKDQIDIEKTSSWKKGKYYYNNEQLTTIIEQLQRWFDQEIIFDKKEMEKYVFTGFIDREKSIEFNLRLIEYTDKINVEFKNNTIAIYGKN